ncbi:MAG: serine/threonine protein kinase [Deltaproteobacteria bacterium]|nr:serine/threonine protein kinase [Deltaproteobacteria bacterium]
MATFPCPWCNATLAAEAFGPRFCPSCGDTLVFGGRFFLTERLGSGGMSVVYAARAETGERAAVKILTLQTAKEWNVLDLFDHGARVLMGVRHPGLPLVYDLSQDQKGRHILVREAFDGGTLEERVLGEGRHLEPPAFRRLFEALLGVVGYLHGLVPPVLHRDIKPSNIMFRTPEDWNPVLVDFDTVALPPERRSGLTVVGTPGYAAPEQFYGEAVPQSDLYGLSATMLCVATHTDVNVLPRGGGRFQLEGRLDNVDPRARSVMLRLLEPDPARRYQTAAEVLWDLRAAGPVQAAPVPRAPALGPRKGPIAIAVVAAALIAMGAAGGVVFFAVRPPVPTPVTPEPLVVPEAPAVRDIEARREQERKQRREIEEAQRRLRREAAEARQQARQKSSGLNPCQPVVPCYQETEEFGQVAGRLEVVVDAAGKITKATYSKGQASAKVQHCLTKAAKALEVPGEAERPAAHVCQWSGTIMGGSQMMMWDRKVVPAGEKAGK